MPASYKIVLTPLAKAAAEKYGSAAVVEAEARAQIRHLFADEASYANMLFHTFEMGGRIYLCAGADGRRNRPAGGYLQPQKRKAPREGAAGRSNAELPETR
jgi:hypothetical protein